MKKIGIITITDYVNYGNRLQNYATQEILKSYGFYVETIKNIPKTEKIDNVEFTKYRLKNALKLSPYTLILKFIEKINEKINYKKYIRAQKLKETSFREFSKKYITESSYVISESYIPEKFDEKFDYFVVGSDQIWNPNLRKGSSFDFIQFAPKGKRIALAPSFGVSIIPDEYKDLYSKWLNEMNFLSIREQKGADLINKLCGRSAEVLIDPTLMLTKQQWLEINESAKLKPIKKYL